jgi:hypothetical protein
MSRPTILTQVVLARVASLVDNGRSAAEIAREILGDPASPVFPTWDKSSAAGYRETRGSRYYNGSGRFGRIECRCTTQFC